MPAGKQKTPALSAETKAAERADLRRKQIFEAATLVFAEKGFHNATVQDVADRAGLGKGTIYEYVTSKKELLFIVIEEGHKIFYDAIEKSVSAQKTCRKKIEAMLDVSLNLMSLHRDAARALIPEVEGMTDEDQARLGCTKERAILTVKNILDEGIRSGEIRRVNSYVMGELLLVCCWEWTKSDTLLTRSRSIRGYRDILCGMFFDGILPKQPTIPEGATKR